MISEVEYADQTPNLCGCCEISLPPCFFAAIGMLIGFLVEQLGVDSRAGGAGISRQVFDTSC